MDIGNGCGKLKCTVSTLLSGRTKDIPNAQIVAKNLGFIVKSNAYKKLTTKECAWCDYYGTKCRKNRKCSFYKKLIKTSMKNRRKQNKLMYI